MAKETEAILRALLFNAMRAKSLKEVQAAIMAMCSSDDIAAVKAQLAELGEKREEETK